MTEPDRTSQVIRDLIDEIRNLAQLEVAQARQDLKSEMKQAKAAGMALGVASGLGVSGFTLLVLSLTLAFPKPWLSTLVSAGALGILAGAMGYRGWKAVPREPFRPTKERLESNLRQLNQRTS